jgi:hypothetical protein
MLTLTFLILKFYKNAGKNREGKNGSAVVLLYCTNQNYIKEYMNYKIYLHLKIAYGYEDKFAIQQFGFRINHMTTDSTCIFI